MWSGTLGRNVQDVKLDKHGVIPLPLKRRLESKKTLKRRSGNVNREDDFQNP